VIHRPKWQGSVLVKRGWLILQLKDDRGRWRQRGTGLKDTPEGRREAERRLAFADAYRMLNNRIGIFVSLPMASLDRLSLQRRLDEIGETAPNKADTDA